MNPIIKAEFYDKFKCIADQCSFTCCKGWDISVDPDTCSSWINDEKHSDYLSKHLKVKKNNKAAFINMGTQKACPYQNEKGLCNIVINCGEDLLSETCKVFPRLRNDFSDRIEYTMSCACPEVIDLINSKDNVQFLYESQQNLMQGASKEYKIRETMISILRRTDFSFKDKVLLIFQLLLSMRKGEENTAELTTYQVNEFLSALSAIWTGIEINSSDTLLETNEMFLDMIQNYRKVKNFKPYLQELNEMAEGIDLEGESFLTYLGGFSKEYEAYEKLLENCMIIKMFSECTSNDIEEMIVSYQVIITEYLMIRHSAFLKYLKNHILSSKNSNGSDSKLDKDIEHQAKLLSYTDIRDYIVIYSRIIGYNSEGIREFWEESFDDAVWDLGYLMLLLG